MKKYKKNSLLKNVVTDFICSNKLLLILLLISLVSAFYVINITYKTRKLTQDIDTLIKKNNKVLNEWSNLIVEYHTLKEQYEENNRVLINKYHINPDLIKT